MMCNDRMRRRFARALRRIADQVDKSAPITIDLQNNMIYTDASKGIDDRDISRMYAYRDAFFGI